MKVKSLVISNIGLIVSEVIALDKPLILFYGEIRQGKTTILNAVRYAFGGSFPADLIRHGQAEGHVQIDFDNGYVRREFYRGENGECKARPVVFVENNVRVPRPVDRLKKFLNPFMLDQDFLTRMSELDRKKFFADLFQTATADLDQENSKCAADAHELRIKVKTYGDVRPVKVERVDLAKLLGQREQLQARNKAKREAHAVLVKEVDDHNSNVQAATEAMNQWDAEITRLATALSHAQAEKDKVVGFLKVNQTRAYAVEPNLEAPGLLETEIMNAGAQNVRAEQAEKDSKRLEAKLADEKRILELERRQRAIRDEKIKRLDQISNQCGVPGLEFREEGEFAFEDTQPGMLSTSQLMRLSQYLSSLYPEGLGLDLVDRAESLGTAIFEFVEKAKREDKTILATIVGERPATVPENVGVFVVASGKIS